MNNVKEQMQNIATQRKEYALTHYRLKLLARFHVQHSCSRFLRLKHPIHYFRCKTTHITTFFHHVLKSGNSPDRREHFRYKCDNSISQQRRFIIPPISSLPAAQASRGRANVTGTALPSTPKSKPTACSPGVSF